MSLEAFKDRMPENVAGRFYVDGQCLDCDLCRETAPANFAHNDDGGYSYVKKQPESPEEEAACQEAVRCCCTEAIFVDGDNFDWNAIPPAVPYHLTPEYQAVRLQRENGSNCCSHKHGDSEESV